MLMFAQQFSGISVFTLYIKPIFLQAGSTLDAGLSSFIVNLVHVSFSFKLSITTFRIHFLNIPNGSINGKILYTTGHSSNHP